jgi:hypothetical protein
MLESRRAPSSAALTNGANDSMDIAYLSTLSALAGSGIDLLKDFSEVAREELRAFTTL